MLTRSNRFIATAALALFSFLAVAYFSCTKSNYITSCSGVVCDNGGYCRMDTSTNQPKCICPVGYEGLNCSILAVNKYIGTWDVAQKIIGSDSTKYIGKDSAYMVFIKQASTNTTFFIDNFFNNQTYNNVLCTVDSGDSRLFTVDSITPFHMYYDNFQMKYGRGSIASDTLIDLTMIIRYKNQTTNWEVDTISFKMRPHIN